VTFLRLEVIERLRAAHQLAATSDEGAAAAAAEHAAIEFEHAPTEEEKAEARRLWRAGQVSTPRSATPRLRVVRDEDDGRA
jgi:hypothetical protein